MPNAIIYTRVSTDEQAERGFSLKHQEDILRRYCDLKNIDIAHHFVDDYSAKDFNRPSFQQLMEFVKINRLKVDQLLITKWDRFSRNSEESYKTIRKLKALGVQVNAIEQPLDLTQPDSKVMLAIYLAIPEVENDKISIRTKEGMRRGKKEGCWMGTPPYGYSNHRTFDDKSSLIPNEKAQLVQEAFRIYSKGLYKAEEVRRMMNKKGMKLVKQQFLNLLRNPAYIGKVHLKAYGKEEEQLIEGLHDAIIENDLFQLCQQLLRDTCRKTPKSAKANELLPLRGFLQCSICKSNLTGSGSRSRSGAKHYYYHCQKGCKERFKAPLANQLFQEYLGSIKICKEVETLYLEILKDVFYSNEKDRKLEIQRIKKSIEKLQKRLSTAQDSYLDGNLEQSDYNSMKKRLDGQINDHLMRMTELKFEDKELMKKLSFGLNFLGNMDFYYQKAELPLKQKILGSIFKGKLVFSENKYRTSNINEVLNTISVKSKAIEGVNVKQVGNIANLSNWAPPLGLEPRTY